MRNCVQPKQADGQRLGQRGNELSAEPQRLDRYKYFSDAASFSLVLLFLYGGIRGIKVMIPNGPMSFEDSTRDFDFSGEMKKCSGLDRMSILLKSGAAVSVVWKSDGLHGGGEFLYWYGVEITVDPSGKLLWPDPDRPIKIKTKPDWELHVLDFGEVKKASTGEDMEIKATPDLRSQPLSTGQQLDKDDEESRGHVFGIPG